VNYNFCTLIDKKQRVDMYLSALFKDFSRSYIQKMIDNDQLKVNWVVLNKNKKISPKDEIELEIKTEKLDEVLPEKMSLDIIFENNDILVINKDPWINVHPVPWENWNKNTLVNGVLYHCKNDLPTINWVERPGIVHRLDKDTSWVIMIAKNDKMMKELSELIKTKKVGKYYLAIVNGLIKEKEFKIESYIGRDPNDRKKMTIKSPVNPKEAITYGKLIDYIDNKYSLLMLKLETWRTHQIRVHLASIGYPIIWDKTYWNTKVNKEVLEKYWLDRQALHAYFVDINLFWKDYKFVAPLKEDMKKIIKKEIETKF